MIETLIKPEHEAALSAYRTTIGYGVLRLAFDLATWPPDDLAPRRCDLCGERHKVCPTHGDMGCDGEAVANEFCPTCAEERAARRGELEP